MGGIAAVAIVGVLAILPYRMYERDIRHARVEAHRLGSVIHVGVSEAVSRGEDIRSLVNRLQNVGGVEMALRTLQPGEELPMDRRRGALTRVLGTDFSYVAPAVLAPDGQTWLTEMHFDLAPVRRESIRIILDLVIAVVLGSLVFSAVIYLLVRRGLLVPLRAVTEHIVRLEGGGSDSALPRFQTREIRDLAETAERACRRS
ncbi:MAG: hypothetical protein GY725_26400 [bacterium]|nr:hypothetical protein [bacterium]